MPINSTDGYKEIPAGAMIPEPATALAYKTGAWRTGKKPQHDKEKCTNCLFCWLFCPDSAIVVKDAKIVGVNYDYCKGCGLCESECPVKGKAIKMVDEAVGAVCAK